MSGTKSEIDFNYSFDFFLPECILCNKISKKRFGGNWISSSESMNLQSMGYGSSENNDQSM